MDKGAGWRDLFVVAAIITLPIPLWHFTPGSAVYLLGLGLMERDGIVIVIGFATSMLAFVIVTLAFAGTVGAVRHWLFG